MTDQSNNPQASNQQNPQAMMQNMQNMQNPQMGMGSGQMQQGNPMMQMMQMMQMMMGGGMQPMNVDPSAVPFMANQAETDDDKGLLADIIRPATLPNLIKQQSAIELQSVLDLLCLTEDGQYCIGGIPKGCTIAIAGPPGKGKTRTSLAGMLRVAMAGNKVAYVIAEEGFYDSQSSGRDDLCSRMVKLGMNATGLDEENFKKDVLENVWVLESQYHKGKSWDDFISKYRHLVETEGIDFVVIDSLNMLDPSKNRTADNLSALKTYNHEKGVTCICIGQVKDTGGPVGGEALQHTADAVFLIESMSLGSKDIAKLWGGVYRQKIDVIRAIKSVTTPIFPHPVRMSKEENSGVMVIHEKQPEIYMPPGKKA